MSKYKKYYPYEKSLLLTSSLFLELRNPTSKTQPLYTLAHQDYTDPETGIVYISIRDRYLAFKDPSESAVAETYFYDHAHWDTIAEHAVLSKYVAEWRVSLERNMQEDAIEHIRARAEEGNFAAAKWLAEKSWKASLDERQSLARKPKKDKSIPLADAEEASEDAKRVLAFLRPRGVA